MSVSCRSRWHAFALMALAVLVVSCTPTAKPRIEPAPKLPPAPTTQWKPWGPAAFEQAKREGRIVLVDAGIEGCTACRVMHETTYQNPKVRRRIAEKFVAVSVDADQQPDLGSRYEAWGWPATIFLSADGKQLRALRGRFEADDLLNVMAEVEKDPTPRGGPTGGPSLEDLDLSARCTAMVTRLDEVGDEHGWGGKTRVIGSAPVLYSFHRASLHDETTRTERALAATTGFRQLLDPVWGGVFVAARNPDWSEIIPEKRLLHQAQAIEAFATAFRHDKDEAWTAAASEVLRYLDDWLRAPDGTYYATQDDEPDEPGLPVGMSAREYFNLSDEHRRKYGVPPVDHGVYTDQNARLVRALVMLSAATEAEEPGPILERARTTMTALQKRMTSAGWVRQVTPAAALSKDERLRLTATEERLYLAPQVHLGLAALAFHQVTKEAQWLALAKSVGQAMVPLQDADGGFFAGDKRPTDGLVPRTKPYLDNLYAARFYTWLGTVTESDADVERAERVLRYAGNKGVLLMRGPANIATYAHALDEFLNRKLSGTASPLCAK